MGGRHALPNTRWLSFFSFLGNGWASFSCECAEKVGWKCSISICLIVWRFQNSLRERFVSLHSFNSPEGSVTEIFDLEELSRDSVECCKPNLNNVIISSNRNRRTPPREPNITPDKFIRRAKWREKGCEQDKSGFVFILDQLRTRREICDCVITKSSFAKPVETSFLQVFLAWFNVRVAGGSKT